MSSPLLCLGLISDDRNPQIIEHGLEDSNLTEDTDAPGEWSAEDKKEDPEVTIDGRR